MKVRWKYRKNKHQVQFHDDVMTKFLLLSGGYGSGKSYGLVMKAFQLSWLNRDLPGGLLVPSYTEYMRDVLPQLTEILEEHRLMKYCKYHGSHRTWTFPWSKAPLYVVTAEKKLKGPNWAYGLINEVGLIHFDRFREMMGRIRIRGAPCPQIAAVGTYEGIYPEYDEFFWDNPNPRARVIQASTRDNSMNLADDYIPTLEGAYDSKMVQAYIDGDRVNMNGNLFYYSYDPNRNDVRGYKIPPECLGFLVTIDFNVDPFCAAIWVQDSKGVVAVDQVKLSGQRGFDTKQMGQALIARGYNGDNSVIFPDPAGQSRSTKGAPDIQQLKDMGFREVRVKSAAPRMRARQLNANNLLEKGIVRIDPEKCPDLKKDLQKVTQDRVTLEKVKDNPELTHFSDGMDYMLDILFPWSGKRVSNTETRIR